MVKSSGAQPPIPTAPEPMAAKSLRALRARAHTLRPVVWIAATGPTEGVMQELDRALAVHELVKIHAAIDDRNERSRLLQSLCEALGAQPVQTIGKMLVAFRARPPSAEAPTQKTGSERGKQGGRKPPARRVRASGPPPGRTRASAGPRKAAAATTPRMRGRSR
jgi:putative YhbY family RNA-binding protein